MKFLLATIFLAVSLVFAQGEMPLTPQASITYFFDAVNVSVPDAPEKSRVNVYIQVKYDDLQFVKTENDYEANYECSVALYDRHDDFQVDGRIWKETIRVAQYEQTNLSDTFSFTFVRLDVPPADYNMIVTVADLESEKQQSYRSRIEARDFSKNNLEISDLTFASRLEFDTLGIKSIKPVVSSRYKGLPAPSFVFFEIYNHTDKDQAKIEYEFEGENTEDRTKDELEWPLVNGRNLVFFELPIKDLRHDIYRLKVRVKVGRDKAEVGKVFHVRWEGMPYTARDLESAIEQVQFIATPEEWRRLKSASEEKKKEAYLLFWKRHDPTPDTPANEAMQRHYSRIETANQQFSVMNRDGWKTDRGMLYIILGPPDEVIRDPYPSNSRPWEVWNYNRINRSFEFVDITGFGDYRFNHPYSMHELQMHMR